MSKKLVYMDNNATTPLHPEVKKAMIDAFSSYGNPSSLHSSGREARKLIEISRQSVAKFIGADANEVIFLGSGSEANNTVLNICCCASSACSHTNLCNPALLTSQIEHPCVLETAKCLKERGKEVMFIEVDSLGKVNLEKVKNSLSSKTVGLVSVMMANNEIGTIQDISKIAELVHSYGALMHTDAVQALGKIPVDVRELQVDFLSLSAHKIYGPKGVGALFVRKGIPFCPFIRGGHQEQGRRAGTENLLGIVGFGKAVEMLGTEMNEVNDRVCGLRERLKNGILENIPDIKINGHQQDIVPNTLNVSFEGAEGEAILLYLDLEGIAVSTGSACSSGSLDPSHVLLATGLDAERAHGSIRFSLGRENTEEDVDYVLQKLPLVIQKIRDMSTAYNS